MSHLVVLCLTAISALSRVISRLINNDKFSLTPSAQDGDPISCNLYVGQFDQDWSGLFMGNTVPYHDTPKLGSRYGRWPASPNPGYFCPSRSLVRADSNLRHMAPPGGTATHQEFRW